jgi:hypothetical protein
VARIHRIRKVFRRGDRSAKWLVFNACRFSDPAPLEFAIRSSEMATKSKKKKPRRAKGNAPKEGAAVAAEAKEEIELSQATYIDRRDERIAHYYFVRRILKPPAIYDFLIRECRDCLGPDVGSAHSNPDEKHKFVPLISSNRASGLRTVQEVVMRFRAEAEPEEILKLRRPIETAKVVRTLEYLLQKQIDVIEDSSMVKVQKLSPSGLVVTVLEPRCSKLDKGKAGKAAMMLAEKIGKLTGAVFEPADEAPLGADGQPEEKKPFEFVFPNVKGSTNDLSEMVAMNLEQRKVN